MYRITVPRRIDQVISLFSFIGICSDKNRSDFCERCLKTSHLVLCIWFTISLFAGLLVSDNETETILIAVVAQTCVLHTAKLYYFLRKEDEILGFIRSMGAVSIEDHHEFHRVNNKINDFIKFVTELHSTVFCGVVAFVIAALPFLSDKKRLPVNVYTPVNWKNGEINYWLMFLFTLCQILLCYVYDIFNAFIWNLGNSDEAVLNKVLPTARKQDLFLEALITLTQKHQSLQKTTEQFRLCFSNLFFIQLVFSGFKICGSVYALAFISFENAFIYNSVCLVIAVHNFFDIFMVTFFGNEIKFSSGRLSYCLFECNWMDQSTLSKRSLCIMMEVLKRAQILVIGKLYSLDLQIFSKISNFAYSMFNILKSLK